MRLDICAVVLRSFCQPFIEELELNYETPEDKFEAVRNEASDSGNDDIMEILNYIESRDLVRTFFPE